jgi:hypothetical protein
LNLKEIEKFHPYLETAEIIGDQIEGVGKKDVFVGL